MSAQLFEQVTVHDGDHHWFKYVPALELVRCRECRFSRLLERADVNVPRAQVERLWCRLREWETEPMGFCSEGSDR